MVSEVCSLTTDCLGYSPLQFICVAEFMEQPQSVLKLSALLSEHAYSLVGIPIMRKSAVGPRPIQDSPRIIE